MTPEERELLEATYELARKNNKLLKRMRRASFIGTIVKLIIYSAMLGVPVWMYFQFLQPILGDLMHTLNQVQKIGGQVQNATHGVTGQVQNVQGIINSIPGLDLLKNLRQ